MTQTSLAQRDDVQKLIDHIPRTAVWIASGKSSFEYISSGFEEIWGIPPEAVYEDIPRLIESIHPDDRDRVRSYIEQPPHEISSVSYDARVVQPDGTVRWTQTRHFPLRDEMGDLSYVVGISTDITEQKRREQELEALNRIIRHDIRNDMSIVRGWVELLQDHVDEEGADCLRRIRTSSEHAVELTEIAHEYVETVVDGEDIELNPRPLRPTLEHEIKLRRESFSRDEFELSADIPDVEVRANEMLASVFGNLLSNAVQHNDKENPTVEISYDVRDEDIVVHIADNGPGISDAEKESIFEKGRKGLASSGTGNGLYLVRTLVEKYGGQLWVEDDGPVGSVFHVRLLRAG